MTFIEKIKYLFFNHILDDPEISNKVYYDVLIKSARRCAYDLSHAASDCHEPVLRDLYFKRANLWQEMFSSAEEQKKYVSELLIENQLLKHDLKVLGDRCKEAGLEYHDLKSNYDIDIPF